MPSYVPPKKNTAFIFYATLRSQADNNIFQVNPTLATGDFKVSIDDGALNNLTTLPTVSPASSVFVKISLSSSEMNGDNIKVIASDAAGAEWCDAAFNIQTSARQVDDLAFPATSGRSIQVETDGMVHGDVKEWLGVAPSALISGRVDANTQAIATTIEDSIVDKTWDEAIAGHIGAGSTGNLVERLDIILAGGAGEFTAARAANLANLDATISSRLATAGYTAPDNAGIASISSRIPAALDTGRIIAKAEVVTDKSGYTISGTKTTLDALNDPTVGAIADQVWDEILSGHLGAGSTGEALNAAGAAGDPWTTALPGAYGAGSAGFIIGTNLNAKVGDVEADTQNIQSRLPAALVGGRMASNAEVVGDKTGYSISGTKTTLDALNDISVNDVWDEVLTGATHNVANSAGRRIRNLQEYGVYEDGAIWIDTVNGSPGVDLYESGTVFNPVNSIADANTLASALNINRFRVAPGSTITFAASQTGQEFIGSNWTLALGGQNIANSNFVGASVSGIGTGSSYTFNNCTINNVTLADGKLVNCALVGTITVSAAGSYYLDQCYSAVAGAGTPIFDFGGAIANTNLAMRHYSGGIQIDNKNASGTDQMSLEGHGQLIVSASSSGAIQVRGAFRITNTGGATITYDDPASNVITINNKIGAFTGSGDNTILGFIRASLRNDLSAPSDIGGTFDPLTDSQESIANEAMDIEADTVDIQTRLPAALIAGRMDSNMQATGVGVIDATSIATDAIGAAELAVSAAQKIRDEILSDATKFAGANIDAAISSRATPAQVNLEVVDALRTDTYGEPGQAALPVSTSIGEKIDYTYKFIRNKLDNDGSTIQLYNDAGTVVDHKSPISDVGGLFTRGEFISGP